MYIQLCCCYLDLDPLSHQGGHQSTLKSVPIIHCFLTIICVEIFVMTDLDTYCYHFCHIINRQRSIEQITISRLI